MRSLEPSLNAAEAQCLLDMARASIISGLNTGKEMQPDPGICPDALREARGCFVSLHRGEELRGCIGLLKPRRTLIEDVAHCAWSAASRDPRMEPVSREELPDLNISLSVLSPPRPLHALTEKELVAELRPGIDGLTVNEGGRCGTLLPVVWHTISDPLEFVHTVKRKAGLAPDYWSDTIRWEHYEAEEYDEAAYR